ncbi:hypothetical protein BXZ70DRAFT_944944, partial [Cristinia sonorae]
MASHYFISSLRLFSLVLSASRTRFIFLDFFPSLLSCSRSLCQPHHVSRTSLFQVGAIFDGVVLLWPIGDPGDITSLGIRCISLVLC